VVFVTTGEYLLNTQQLLGFPNILSTSSRNTDLFQEPPDDVKTLQPENRKYCTEECFHTTGSVTQIHSRELKFSHHGLSPQKKQDMYRPSTEEAAWHYISFKISSHTHPCYDHFHVHTSGYLPHEHT